MLVKPQAALTAKIKVVGVGGGGGNALNTMIEKHNIEDVEFIAVNTDAQALVNSKADVKLRIGEQITRGLGSGGNPVIGRKAAEESVDMLHENLAGADMVFITAGMGGGTGTGAAPVVAGISKNLGALTVAVVTKPFQFEMQRRMDLAISGIDDLRDKVDTLIVVPNQRLLEIMDKNASFLDAMNKADDVLAQAVRSIANLITQSGLINVDFADVRSVMDDGGAALMGLGLASGDDRAREAAQQAIESPLLEISIDGAKGILFNIIGGRDLSMSEVNDAAELVRSKVAPDATFIFGASIDESMDEKIEVTVLATGFDSVQSHNKIFSANLGSSDEKSTQAAQRGMEANASEESDESENQDEEAPQQEHSEEENKKSRMGGMFGNFGGTNDPESSSNYDNEDLETLPSFLRRRKK